MILLSAGHSISPQGFWYSWVEAPLVTIVVFALTAMYLVGWFRLKEQAPRYTRDSWRLWCYLGGVFSLTMALLSPLAAYSEELFAAHGAAPAPPDRCPASDPAWRPIGPTPLGDAGVSAHDYRPATSSGPTTVDDRPLVHDTDYRHSGLCWISRDLAHSSIL